MKYVKLCQEISMFFQFSTLENINSKPNNWEYRLYIFSKSTKCTVTCNDKDTPFPFFLPIFYCIQNKPINQNACLLIPFKTIHLYLSFLIDPYYQYFYLLCIFIKVSNDVATLSVETTLVVERTTPHAPSNVTVTKKVFVNLIP